ncbi:MAG: hypothetical protein KQH53_03210 [Desulfarculaceae bacterium]|nr:hypothetical protein [Desulfarculaceae bacterium]
MALFKYCGAMVEWQPAKGYRNLITSEWVDSPVDAVAAYVDQKPEERQEFITLAKRIQDFWSAHAGDAGDLPAFDEVNFEN